ncbi:tRNA pseudouridine(55) synthase TruB [Veillonella criceti]|uniref:tRNA pseudouridine synthase B n=1 Tax=Veillonella criceti TaxID=103891 RepID=A0A380NH01_9FIRM|nr:tRNA pseudouridine(55) synthase TruB [Veillonella criceti]SUP40445.1 tRNA pseudouridine synthase B [Veillonella criceti]
MDGVFPFLKPPGITSHDAVGICRRILKERRIGHSGTLDPLAYGVLPIFVGKATRIIEYTESASKTYVAECRFGYGTDTEDSTGTPLMAEIIPSHIPTWSQLEQVLIGFVGEQLQQPSIYSAIKINGRRAYELAREGIEFTLPSRTITISECQLLAYSYPYFTIRVSCSAGTYIRALLRDITTRLGIPGTMTQLVRTAVGPYSIEQAITAEELTVKGAACIYPTESALSHMPTVTVSAEGRLALKQGKQWPYEAIPHFKGIVRQLYCAYSDEGFFGVLEGTNDTLKVAKNIFL